MRGKIGSCCFGRSKSCSPDGMHPVLTLAFSSNPKRCASRLLSYLRRGGTRTAFFVLNRGIDSCPSTPGHVLRLKYRVKDRS